MRDLNLLAIGFVSAVLSCSNADFSGRTLERKQLGSDGAGSPQGNGPSGSGVDDEHVSRQDGIPGGNTGAGDPNGTTPGSGGSNSGGPNGGGTTAGGPNGGGPGGPGPGGAPGGSNPNDPGGSGTGDPNNPGGSPPGGSNPNGGGGQPPNGIPPGGQTPVPQICSVGTGLIITDYGQCPAHHAAYTIDDYDNIKIGCCPLPTRDILVGSPVPRYQTCGAGEVVTGVQGNQLLCSPINRTRYRLQPASVCYYGDGVAGGFLSQRCQNTPPSIAQIVEQVLGSDGCVGFPYGSLITSKRSKQCRGMSSSQLQYLDGLPVPMLPR